MFITKKTKKITAFSASHIPFTIEQYQNEHSNDYLIIEHCIIGERLFISSSPHFGAFYNNEKNIFFYIELLAISQKCQIESFV